MVKTLQKSPEPVERFPRNFLSSIKDLGLIIVCSNDDPRLTLTYFVARSNGNFFSIGKSENWIFQKLLQPVGPESWYRQLIELMKVCKY